jgi:hypothetical protein
MRSQISSDLLLIDCAFNKPRRSALLGDTEEVAGDGRDDAGSQRAAAAAGRACFSHTLPLRMTRFCSPAARRRFKSFRSS